MYIVLITNRVQSFSYLKYFSFLNVPFGFRDFYFRAPGSLVVLSFPQLVSFSSVFPKPLSKTVTSAGTAGCPMVEHL
jgi:hypothetical protein